MLRRCSGGAGSHLPILLPGTRRGSQAARPAFCSFEAEVRSSWRQPDCPSGGEESRHSGRPTVWSFGAEEVRHTCSFGGGEEVGSSGKPPICACGGGEVRSSRRPRIHSCGGEEVGGSSGKAHHLSRGSFSANFRCSPKATEARRESVFLRLGGIRGPGHLRFRRCGWRHPLRR